MGDIVGCQLVCVLVGERPGLVTDKEYVCLPDLSAPHRRAGIQRTVLSNIPRPGTPAVEAGAHIAELIETILRKKVSGVQLHLEEGA